MTRSALSETIDRLASRAAAAVVARSRLNAPALNGVLLRRLAAAPGNPDSLIADPVFEAARIWKTAPCCLGDLAGNLLHPDWSQHWTARRQSGCHPTGSPSCISLKPGKPREMACPSW